MVCIGAGDQVPYPYASWTIGGQYPIEGIELGPGRFIGIVGPVAVSIGDGTDAVAMEVAADALLLLLLLLH